MRTLRSALAVVALCSIGCDQLGSSTPRLSVAEVKSQIRDIEGIDVTVQGTVNQILRSEEAGSPVTGYMLRDRFGDLIVVRSTLPPPDTTSPILVTGRVMLRREVPGQEVALMANSWRVDRPSWLYALLGVTGLALLVLVGLLGYTYWGGAESTVSVPHPAAPSVGGGAVSPGYAPGPSTLGNFAPPPQVHGPSPEAPPEIMRVSDDRTTPVNVYLRDKTSQVMPGHLAILKDGAETGKVSLFGYQGQGVEIGRSHPTLQYGVRIDDPTNTLSRHQARIFYHKDRDEFTVTSLAEEGSNPTLFNGRPLRCQETAPLQHGDVLGMGLMEFRFKKGRPGA